MTTRALRASVLFALLAGAATDSWAQSAIEEITVTAQRRAENLESVPITVAAFDRDSLAAAGLSEAADLAQLTPGVVINEMAGSSQLFIRGIGADIFQPGTSPSVATYVDGVYVPLAAATNQPFMDVERVEVLKGPQGTLYGRNAAGGAVNIITRRPPERFEFSASADVGNYSRKAGGFFAGGPVSETLGVSLSGFYRERDTYLDNLRAGGPEIPGNSEYGGRFKALYKTQAGLEAEVMLSRVKSNKDEGETWGQSDPNWISRPADVWTDERNTLYEDYPARSRFDDKAASLRLALPLNDLTLVSLTGFRESVWSSASDFDSSSLPITFFDAVEVDRSVSQELQLASNGEGRVEWLAGLYFFKLSSEYDPLRVGGDPADLNSTIVVHALVDMKSYAAFGQARYAINDALGLTVGGRFSKDKAEYDGFDMTTASGFVISPPGSLAGSTDWSDFSPKFSIDYTIDKTLLFASVTKGYKAGAYNLSGYTPGAQGPVDPEKVLAVELGLKSRLWGGRARAELSAYRYRYEDLHVSTAGDENGPQRLVNADRASVLGLEATLTARATDSVTVNFGASWMPEAKFDEYRAGQEFIRDPAKPSAPGFLPVTGVFDGNRMPRTPKLSGNVGLDYTRALGTGSLRLSGNLYYTEEYFFQAQNSPLGAQDSYSLLNARMQYSSAGERWWVALWGTNVTDEFYADTHNLNALGINRAYGQPRMWGVSVGTTLK